MSAGCPAGVIFGCTDGTLDECLRRGLFGLPESYRSIVERIEWGTELFLFNYTTRRLTCGFLAKSEGGWRLVPEAFEGCYQAQVRVEQEKFKLPTLEECDYEHIMERLPNDPRRFCFELNEDQVQDLLTLAERIGRPLKSSRGGEPGVGPGKRPRSNHGRREEHRRKKERAPFKRRTLGSSTAPPGRSFKNVRSRSVDEQRPPPCVPNRQPARGWFDLPKLNLRGGKSDGTAPCFDYCELAQTPQVKEEDGESSQRESQWVGAVVERMHQDWQEWRAKGEDFIRCRYNPEHLRGDAKFEVYRSVYERAFEEFQLGCQPGPEDSMMD